jgi:purine-cytosine permease-like protein
MAPDRSDERHINSSEAHFDTWVQVATRYFVLANAGAAVATLSFLAARPGSSMPLFVGILALICFVSGVSVAGIAIMGQLTLAYRRLTSDDFEDPVAAEVSIRKSWVTRFFDRAEPHTGTLLVTAFGLFVVGCVLGLLGLFAAACSKVV